MQGSSNKKKDSCLLMLPTPSLTLRDQFWLEDLVSSQSYSGGVFIFFDSLGSYLTTSSLVVSQNNPAYVAHVEALCGLPIAGTTGYFRGSQTTYVVEGLASQLSSHRGYYESTFQKKTLELHLLLETLDPFLLLGELFTLGLLLT